MEAQIKEIKELYNENDYVSERLPNLISAVFPKLRRGRTYNEIAELLGIPYSYVIKWGRYGTSHLSNSGKKEIRERDGNMCRNCHLKETGNPTAILHIHHIYSARNNNDSNLITVCNFCHQTLHKLRRVDKQGYKDLISRIKV